MDNPLGYYSQTVKQFIDITDLKILQNQCLNSLTYDSYESILCLECGSGKVTYRYLRHRCTSKFVRIIGIDTSMALLEVTIGLPDEMSFAYVDITVDDEVETFRKHYGKFTKIFCMSSANWIKCPKRVLTNIKSLMEDNGECIFGFVCHSPVYDTYKQLAMNPKWTRYMMDYEKFIPFSHNAEKPHDIFRSLLEGVGLEVLKCLTEEVSFDSVSQQTLTEHVKGVNTFIRRMPNKHIPEFIQDCVKALPDSQSKNLRYKLLIAHAKNTTSSAEDKTTTDESTENDLHLPGYIEFTLENRGYGKASVGKIFDFVDETNGEISTNDSKSMGSTPTKFPDWCFQGVSSKRKGCSEKDSCSEKRFSHAEEQLSKKHDEVKVHLPEVVYGYSAIGKPTGLTSKY